MPLHSDRRLTLRWAKIGPPQAVAAGSPSDSVTLFERAISPSCSAFLAEGLPAAIPVDQIYRNPLL